MNESGWEWKRFSYDHKTETSPPTDLLVFVFEAGMGSVETGYYDGLTFRLSNGTDDCYITHWAFIKYPDPPKGSAR